MNADAEPATDADLPALHVGDQAVDREDPDATLVVVGLSGAAASEVDIDDQRTVADCNPAWPADDEVVEVIYPERTAVDVEHHRRYSFPRSRLQLVAPVHERDDTEVAG